MKTERALETIESIEIRREYWWKTRAQCTEHKKHGDQSDGSLSFAQGVAPSPPNQLCFFLARAFRSSRLAKAMGGAPKEGAKMG